jgi:exonuclease SbcD
LAANADSYGDDYLRVVVEEPTRAGLRDEVVDLLPNALEVRIDQSFAAQGAAPVIPDRSNQSPIELFSEFCKERQIADPRLETLFAQLLDELTSSDSGAP